MQVAWRTINLSWCFYLGKNDLIEKDKTTILNLQKKHADILLTDFGNQPLNEFNHQSHGALAMLYLAALFPSLPDANILKASAIKIINHHITNAFYPDGGNVEQMFGYYPFVAHIFRDIYLLCLYNQFEQLEKIQLLLNKMVGFIFHVAQPDNTVPPINDSYEESISPILSTLMEIIEKPLKFKRASSCYFPDTQLGIIRNNHNIDKSWYITINPAVLVGAHAHAGRMGVNFWYNNSPFLVDSGCCNYDDPRLVDWYRASRAHNTVIIDGIRDKATSGTKLWVPKRKTGNRIIQWLENSDFQFCRMISPASEPTNSSVTWYRDIVLVKNNYMVIHDCFDSPGNHEFETLFHFHLSEIISNQEDKRIIIKSEETLSFIPVDNTLFTGLKISKAYLSIKGKSVLAPVVSYVFNGQGTIHSAFLIKPVKKENDLQFIKFFQEITENDYKIEITNEESKKDSLLFKSNKFSSGDYFKFQSKSIFN
jgi:hypothetical protein